MAQSLQKNIRVNAEQWNPIEEAAGERDVSPTQLVVELAIEAFDHPKVLPQLLRNALTRNRAGAAEAAVRRLLSIIPPEPLAAMGHDFWQSVFIFEEGFAAANPVPSREA